jgi:quinol monooxygenase YgiN
MAHLLIKHKVKDYPRWKKIFDEFKDTRKAGGEKSYEIFHPEDDPKNLLAIFEWDNLANAKKFVVSPELKAAMSNAGVVEQPEVYYLERYAEGRV